MDYTMWTTNNPRTTLNWKKTFHYTLAEARVKRIQRRKADPANERAIQSMRDYLLKTT